MPWRLLHIQKQGSRYNFDFVINCSVSYVTCACRPSSVCVIQAAELWKLNATFGSCCSCGADHLKLLVTQLIKYTITQSCCVVAEKSCDATAGHCFGTAFFG